MIVPQRALHLPLYYLPHLQGLDAQGTQGSTVLPTGCITSAKGAGEADGLTKSCVNVCRK